MFLVLSSTTTRSQNGLLGTRDLRQRKWRSTEAKTKRQMSDGNISMSENQKTEQIVSFVWVFNGDTHRFPRGVFTDQHLAKEWIEENQLTGTLTAYPINQGVYDWALEKGYFMPKRDDQKTASFIGNFSSASQPHEHYENGE